MEPFHYLKFILDFEKTSIKYGCKIINLATNAIEKSKTKNVY
jgi:hypothetical protein